MKHLKYYIQIFESINTEKEANIIIKNKKLDPSILDKLKAIDTSINQINLPAMAFFWNNNEDDIKSTFDIYNKLLKVKKINPFTIKDKGTKFTIDTETFYDIIKFREWLDSKESKKSVGEKGTINFDSKETPIWEGNNIEIYDGNTIEQCIRYTGAGQQGGTLTGKPYSFCIGLYIPKNMWQTYRDNYISTFYFIIDKNRNFEDPLHIVVYDHQENGILLTDENNKTGNIAEYKSNAEGYKKYLISKGVPVNTLLINKPKNKQEIEDEKILKNENENLEWYKNLPIEYRSRYVGRGHILTDEQFDWLMNNQDIDK